MIAERIECEKSKSRLIALVFVSLLLTSIKVAAMDIPVQITGEILVPPCQINKGKVIDVDFGNISATSISSAHNWRKIDVPVSCEYANGSAYVKIIGPQMNNNRNVLQTSIKNFGIALYQGDGNTTELILGDGEYREGESIGYPIQTGLVGKENGVFTFTAIPFKDAEKNISIGSFISSARIEITYI